MLGQAGPCFIRTSNKLTVIGIMKFDTADLPNMEANGTLNDVILHEMGHVLGFGSIWDDPTKNFLRDAFVGLQSAASAAGQSLHGTAADLRHPFQRRRSPSPRSTTQNGGNTYSGREGPGGELPVALGTADSHWREADLSITSS